MAENLQGLLNKIQTEGVTKAEEEKARILADAKAQAEKIIAEATQKANETAVKAEKDATASELRAEAAIKQTARDVILALNADLAARLKTVTKDMVAQALTPATLSQIILEMVKAGAQSKTGDFGVEILLAKKDSEELEKIIKAGLLANLKAKPVISLGQGFSAGLQLGFTGSDVYFDLSDEALSDIICEFVGSKLAAVIKPSK